MTTTSGLAKKGLIYTLVWTLAFPQTNLAFAAQTDLADVPMYLAGRPKPNLMMAFDDSGSMDFEMSISNTADGSLWFRYGDGRFVGRNATDTNVFTATLTGPINVNPNATNDSSTYKKYTYLFPNGVWVDSASRMRRSYDSAGGDAGAAVPPTREFAWTRSSSYNAVYYNPEIRYLPWAASNNGTTTTTFANSAPAAAPHHPVFSGQVSDLTQDINTNATEWTFRMYPGMVLPTGASYRLCYRDSGDCRTAWSAPTTEDSCIARGTAGTRNADNVTLPSIASCSYAVAPFASGTVASLNLSLSPDSGNHVNHLEVAMPYYAPTYFVRDTALSAGSADSMGPDGAFLRRVEIRTGNAYPKSVNRTDCAGTTCSDVEELQNFANWFTYYRKRLLMMNALIGQSFSGVANLRAGAFTFNNRTNVTMYDVDATTDNVNIRRLLHNFYNLKTNGGTPTRVSLDYLGTQFRRTDTNAPITSACQFNAGFVITDGYASAGTIATSIGNYDAQTNYTTYPYNRQYSTSGATLTNPYSDTASNTLADIAMRHYTENLRPDLPVGKVRFDANDTSPNADRNPNLHMNTYALGINLTGTIFGVDAALSANPFANVMTWPTFNTGVSHRPETIDELWKATINGRGKMFSAKTPEETRNALLDVIDDVIGRDAAGAAVAVSNPVPVLGDNSIYFSEFRSGTWSGDLNGFPIDIVSGSINTATPIWSPSPQKQLAYRSPNSRVIVTYDGAAGVPFRWDSLPANYQSALTPSWLLSGNTGADVVDFLRGERAKEGTTQFRSRGPRGPWASVANVPDNVAVLGDIVNAEPVVVGAPKERWNEAGYSAFRIAQSTRARTVYQGANDGLLHAFDAVTGAERWAYLSGRLIKMPQTLASPLPSWPYLSALTNLGQRVGFAHKFYVDGTPVAGDVDLGCAGGPCGAHTPNWATLLVGGFRKGAFGYYALDVTDPSNSTESAVAAMNVKWEFPNASTLASVVPNVGYSYGRPILAKTAAAGWVVIVSSGYNNGTDVGGSQGNGRGYLFVLNAATGALIRAIDTGVGSPTDPSGLGPLSAWADNAEYDPTVSYIYGGDLRGNLWRFDLTDPTNPTAWSATNVAQLTDASGNSQPITNEPELARIGSDRYVYVGSGRYLGQSDVPGSATATAAATRTYTMYGIKDDLTSTTVTRGSGLLTPVTATRTGSGASSAVTLTAGATGSRGWRIDMPTAGERIDSSAQLVVGALTFTSNVPVGVDPCAPQGASYFWQLNYLNGLQISSSAPPSRWVAAAIASRPIGVQVASGYRSYINPTDGGPVVMSVNPPQSNAPGKRKSWRELTRN